MPIRSSRIVGWSLGFVALLLAFILLAPAFLRPALPESMTCAPLPENVTMVGPALSATQRALAADAFRAEDGFTLQPRDSVHEFETATTGGLLVRRGNCYVGQLVKRIR